MHSWAPDPQISLVHSPPKYEYASSPQPLGPNVHFHAPPGSPPFFPHAMPGHLSPHLHEGGAAGPCLVGPGEFVKHNNAGARQGAGGGRGKGVRGDGAGHNAAGSWWRVGGAVRSSLLAM